eukprot:TRINITY_DN1880_c0_g2_i1.p1 TRINITY_DN1880_c0_g2~~TRINITY_DN1880_c0_g2_i1.p1  ORF type:complete len:746 (+),score=134.59 TRINITY_DN1880_c0_g2_i1:67-2238(+)
MPAPETPSVDEEMGLLTDSTGDLASVRRVLAEYERRLQLLEQQQVRGASVPRADDRNSPSSGSASPRRHKLQGLSDRLAASQSVNSGDARDAAGGSTESVDNSSIFRDQHYKDVKPFKDMWMSEGKMSMTQREVFDKDLLQSIYDKSVQKVKHKAAVFGGGLMVILSMPFGPIGMAAGFSAGALAGGIVGICVDKRREWKKIQQSELEKRRLKSLVRWSAERFSDSADPEDYLRHLEMVILEFKPVADIAASSQNGRKLLKLLDTWSAKKQVMKQLWAYMDRVLVQWKSTTKADFLRSMLVLQTLQNMYHLSNRVLRPEEELFLNRVERLLENESVKYVMSHQHMFSTQEADQIMSSLIAADKERNRKRARTSAPDGTRSPAKSAVSGQDSDSSENEQIEDYGEQDVARGLLLTPQGSPLRPPQSPQDDVLSKDGGEPATSSARPRTLKPPFFKSWEDFMDFDLSFKHKLPITQSDFTLLLEKEKQGMDGWEMCLERTQIKVAKAVSSDGTGCIFLRAWSTLPGVKMPVAFHMFHNCENRMQWDRAFFNMEVVDNVNGSDILYSILKPPAFTPRDYVQYRRVQVQEDGSILFCLRSAEHPLAPEKSGHIRAESYTSGYVIRPYTEGGESGIKMFLMTSTDIKGIIPKWIINYVAPRKPGEWIDALKKACLDYQAANPDLSHLDEALLPYRELDPFDYEDEPEAKMAEKLKQEKEEDEHDRITL